MENQHKYHFTTLQELHDEWKINWACKRGVKFNHSCNSLKELFKNCPLEFRYWRIANGYKQFEKHCNWAELNGFQWYYILAYRPQLVRRCKKFGGFEKFYGSTWFDLLKIYPQLAKLCEKYNGFEKFDNYDWVNLLNFQPHLKKYKK